MKNLTDYIATIVVAFAPFTLILHTGEQTNQLYIELAQMLTFA